MNLEGGGEETGRDENDIQLQCRHSKKSDNQKVTDGYSLFDGGNLSWNRFCSMFQ